MTFEKTVRPRWPSIRRRCWQATPGPIPRRQRKMVLTVPMLPRSRRTDVPVNFMQRLLLSILVAAVTGFSQSSPAPMPVQSSPAAAAQQPEQTPRKVTAKTKEEYDAYKAADAAITNGANLAKGEA